jgi:acyl dehydratase
MMTRHRSRAGASSPRSTEGQVWKLSPHSFIPMLGAHNRAQPTVVLLRLRLRSKAADTRRYSLNWNRECMYYLEDLTDNLEFDLGSVDVSKESIIDFAEKFDPQKFHLDEDVAQKMFGGLIASGWHTASLCNRLLVDGFLGQAACMASPGVDKMRFLKPVYANDRLSGKLSVVSTKQFQSKPDRGLAKLKIEMSNADNELVISMIGNVIIGCKPKA